MTRAKKGEALMARALKKRRVAGTVDSKVSRELGFFHKERVAEALKRGLPAPTFSSSFQLVVIAGLARARENRARAQRAQMP